MPPFACIRLQSFPFVRALVIRLHLFIFFCSRLHLLSISRLDPFHSSQNRVHLAFGNPKPQGRPPRDPWERSKHFTAEVPPARGGTVALSVSLEIEDILLMERVYEQLCLLVQFQRPSDPLSLALLHMVKTAFEAGHTVTRQLLRHVVVSMADMVHGAGMGRWGKWRGGG